MSLYNVLMGKISVSVLFLLSFLPPLLKISGPWTKLHSRLFSSSKTPAKHPKPARLEILEDMLENEIQPTRRVPVLGGWNLTQGCDRFLSSPWSMRSTRWMNECRGHVNISLEKNNTSQQKVTKKAHQKLVVWLWLVKNLPHSWSILQEPILFACRHFFFFCKTKYISVLFDEC